MGAGAWLDAGGGVVLLLGGAGVVLCCCAGAAAGAPPPPAAGLDGGALELAAGAPDEVGAPEEGGAELLGAPDVGGGVVCGGTTGCVAFATTFRKPSFAVLPRFFAWSPCSPGTVMTTLLPSRRTSVPLTPIPLTRRSMIWRAWFRDSREGWPPSGVRAVSVTRVPPCRSMPSFGVGLWLPVRNTSPYSTITIRAKKAR